MIYRVHIAADVQNAILEQAMFIASDSVDRALVWKDQLQLRIEKLEHMPTAYPVSELESVRVGFEVRKLNFGDYLIYFRVLEVEGEVIVVGLRHGAMMPPGELDE